MSDLAQITTFGGMATPLSVVITGANGFIGSRLCLTFLRRGFRVYAGIRPSCDRRLLDGLAVQYRFGDVTDPGSLPDIVADVDYVIHNAGIVKARSQERFYEVNGQGTANLMAAVAQHNPRVKRVVYVSSQAVSGPSDNDRPVSESDSPRPVTAYGRSKRTGEEAMLAYRDTTPVVIVRPAGVYGPGDREMLSLFKVANLRLKAYFGNVCRKLQLVHVDDLCRGVYLATVTDTRSGSIFHLAENRSYTMSELVELLQIATGKTGMSMRISERVFRTIAALSESSCRLVGMTPMFTREKCNELLGSWEVDTSRARKELGFESEIPFERGASETYRWYRERGWI